MSFTNGGLYRFSVFLFSRQPPLAFPSSPLLSLFTAALLIFPILHRRPPSLKVSPLLFFSCRRRCGSCKSPPSSKSATLHRATSSSSLSLCSTISPSFSSVLSTKFIRASKVRLYDISAQRRLATSFDFRETPIKAVAEDIDGSLI